jgi:hypothetical protein
VPVAEHGDKSFNFITGTDDHGERMTDVGLEEENDRQTCEKIDSRDKEGGQDVGIRICEKNKS